MFSRSHALAVLLMALLLTGGCDNSADEDEPAKPLSRQHCIETDAEGDLAKDREFWTSLTHKEKTNLALLYQQGRGPIDAASPEKTLHIERFGNGRMALVVDRYYSRGERGPQCDIENAFMTADRKLIFAALQRAGLQD